MVVCGLFASALQEEVVKRREKVEGAHKGFV